MRMGLYGLYLVFILIACSSDQSATYTLTNSATQRIEQQTHELVNGVRTSQKLEKLRWNDHVAEIARTHSQNMASGKSQMGHDGFEARADGVKKIVAWTSIGENIAYNYGVSDPAAKAVDGWMNSTGHSENILGAFDVTGIGVAENGEKYYFTQIFVKTK